MKFRREKTVRRGAALAGVLFATLTLRAVPVAAGRLTDFSQEELRSLSQLCLSQRFINEELTTPAVSEPERAHQEWEAKLGKSFIHYHHFCWATLYAKRAEQQAAESKFNFDRAVDNFNYVLRNADPEFALLPEVHLEKARALERLDRGEEAAAEYRSAIRGKVDYTPAYVGLAQYYLAVADPNAARGVLEEGLKHDPGSKELAEMKAALAR